MTDAVIKAAFFTLVTSVSSFTDNRSAKAFPASTVDKPDLSNAALHMSVSLPSGLSCTTKLCAMCNPGVFCLQLSTKLASLRTNVLRTVSSKQLINRTYLGESPNTALSCLFLQHINQFLYLCASIFPFSTFKELELDASLLLSRVYQLL